MSSPFQTPSSKQYRVSSKIDSVTQSAKRKLYEESAQTYSQQNNVSMDQAYKVFIDDYDEWKDVEIDDMDMLVGTTMKAATLELCCNSRVINQLYNDTIVVALYHNNNENNENKEPGMEISPPTCITYKKKVDRNMVHSGDHFVDYGLRHIIKFTGHDFSSAYIISSPWSNGHSTNVAELDKTDPILEIRVEDGDGVKKRYVIPQDYTQGFRHTACVNAVLTYDENENERERWKVTVRRDFIHGFADEPETLIQNVQNVQNILK